MAELVGIFEIAEIAGVTPAAVANWRRRHADFPKPVAELRSGPIFHQTAVRKWIKRRRIDMVKVLCMINLKGGVGKTTTTVALSEFLAESMRKKVLVIDLDPQTNATTMLIGEHRWKRLNDAGHTLHTLFNDALLEDEAKARFDLAATLQKDVSNVKKLKGIDLLPSSLDLIDLQDRLGQMSGGRFHSKNPTDVLRRGIRKIVDSYDVVIVDCPPNLGLITLNGLKMADGYLIPTIPDVLSTYGIPQILSRVRAFADELGEDIVPLGIIATKVQGNSSVHQRTINDLRGDPSLPKLLETQIPQSNAIADSAEFSDVSTLKQKYSYGDRYKVFSSLASEVMGVIGNEL